MLEPSLLAVWNCAEPFAGSDYALRRIELEASRPCAASCRYRCPPRLDRSSRLVHMIRDPSVGDRVVEHATLKAEFRRRGRALPSGKDAHEPQLASGPLVQARSRPRARRAVAELEDDAAEIWRRADEVQRAAEFRLCGACWLRSRAGVNVPVALSRR